MLTTQQTNDLRQKVLRNEPVTEEELAEAIKTLRGTRVSASQSSATARKRKSVQTDAEAQNELDDLLGDL